MKGFPTNSQLRVTFVVVVRIADCRSQIAEAKPLGASRTAGRESHLSRLPRVYPEAQDRGDFYRFIAPKGWAELPGL